jgi:hypothetical protein
MRMLTYSTANPWSSDRGFPRIQAQRDLHWSANALRSRWRAVALGAGVGRTVDNATGGADVHPEVTHVHTEADGSITLTVRLLPGQLPSDIAEQARRIAYGMGVAGIRVRRFREQWVKVRLLLVDPLTGSVPPVEPVASALDPVTLGIGETGEPTMMDLATASHIIIQGCTGGGKSVGCYGLLGQLAEAPDVRITGIDPSGLLLRPWAGRWADVPAPALGTRDLFSAVAVLDRLVIEMDRRIQSLPLGMDSVQLGEDCPAILCVLEEYAGFLRALDSSGEKKLATLARAHIGRLLAEGRKAGVRLLLVIQRADANLIGGYERSQTSHRISYRVEAAAVEMLHPDVTPGTAAAHATAAAGVALLTAPGVPLRRIRSPYLDYADYCASVAGTEAAA